MGSMDFNGTTSVGTVAHHSSLDVGNWTIAGWIKVTGAGEGDFRIFNKASAANAGCLQVTGMAGGSLLRGRQITTGTAAVAISHNVEDALTLNTWVCVFVRSLASDPTQRIRIYKYNGVSVNELTYSSVTQSADPTAFNSNDLYIGNTSDGSLALDGKMAYWALASSVWDNPTMLDFATGTVPGGTHSFWPMQGDGSNIGAFTGRTIAFTNTTFDAGDSPPVSYGGGGGGVFLQDRSTGIWLGGDSLVQVVQNSNQVDIPFAMTLGGPSAHVVSANTPGAPADNFNRPNAATLGGAWAEHSGTWAILDNRAVCTGAPGVASMSNVADVEVTSDVIVPPTGDLVMGVCARVFDETQLIGAEIVRTATEQKVIAFRRIGGQDREIGSTGVPVLSGTHQLTLRAVGRDVLIQFDGTPVLSCRISASEHAALTGTRTGLVAFTAPAGGAWDNFVTDDSPAPIVVPHLRATFNHSDVAWLESGGSINGWHEWASTSSAWQVTSNEAAQLTTGYAPVTVPTGGTEPIGVTVSALGQEFWLLFRANNHENYYRFGRSSSGNYTVQKIEANALGTIAGGTALTTITPIGGDRLQVEENPLGGFDCYVIRGGVPTHFYEATDTEWVEYADQAGLAAFDSAGLRFDDFTMEGSSGTLDAEIPMQVVDLAGELTFISSNLDITIPMQVVEFGGGTTDTVAATLDAEIPMQVVALTGRGPNSMRLECEIPMLTFELGAVSDAQPPVDGGVTVRPPMSIFDVVFPVRWPPPRWARRRIT